MIVKEENECYQHHLNIRFEEEQTDNKYPIHTVRLCSHLTHLREINQILFIMNHLVYPFWVCLILELALK